MVVPSMRYALAGTIPIGVTSARFCRCLKMRSVALVSGAFAVTAMESVDTAKLSNRI